MFTPGMQKVPGSGKQPGTKNRDTILREYQAASAMAVFRDMGVSLPQLGAQLTNVLNALAVAQMPADKQGVEAIRALSPAQQDRLAKFCKMGVDAIAAMMEFAYPKLARVDYVGDLPTAPQGDGASVLQFVLNISGQPGRPVEQGSNGHDPSVVTIEQHGGGNGDGAERGTDDQQD